MAIQQGVFNSSFNPDQLNSRSFADSILRLFPEGQAPLFALTGQSGKTRAVSSTHGYFTRTFTFQELTTTASALVGATTIAVGNAVGVVAGQLYVVPSTREIVKVVSVAGLNLTVIRGFGRIAAGAIGAAEVLYPAGTAYAEGAARPTARNLSTTYVPNYTQIFRNSWSVTGTATASQTEAGMGNVAESREDMVMFHAADMETALFFGQPKLIVAPNAQPEHTTQGVMDAITQYAPANVQLAGATTNLTQLETMLEPMYQYSTNMSSSKERVAFVDAQSLRVINQIARANGVVELLPDQTTFGLSFNKFRFFKGEIKLIEHPMLSKINALAGSMVVLDLPSVKLAYMEGRDALVESYGINGQQTTNGEDSVGGSILSEFAAEFVNPQACAVVSGLTAGVAG